MFEVDKELFQLEEHKKGVPKGPVPEWKIVQQNDNEEDVRCREKRTH